MVGSSKDAKAVQVSQNAFPDPDSGPKAPLISSLGPRQPFFQGWRNGVAAGAFVVTLVLLINVSVAIGIVVHFGAEEGLTVLYQGNCNHVSQINFGIHLAINVLGTLLLAASNYSMQVLSAPTRKEVDRAHAQRKWLDIGLSSFRNLGKIRRWRLWVWILLLVASLPLHLVYNTVVFSTITAYQYTGVLVSPAFVGGPLYEGSLNVWLDDTVVHNTPSLADVQRVQADVAEFERLENAECISRYHKALVTDRSDVVLVSSFHNASDEKVMVYLALRDGDFYLDFEGIAAWITDTYNITAFDDWLFYEEMPDPGTWSIEDHLIDYCLSRAHREVCKIKSSLSLMAFVIICNLVKLVGMLVTLFKHKEDPLVTVGDAVSSFMTVPDDTTINACLISKGDVKSGRFYKKTTHVRPWQRRRVFRFQTVSSRRWWLSMVVCGTGIIVVVIFLKLAIAGIGQLGTLSNAASTPTLSQIWGLGFGMGDGTSFWTNAPRSLYGNILLANLPQLIFSMLYFVYNGLYTVMSLAAEWSKFSRRRQGLRVSRPVGAQRSTYYLQLPYKYAVPLIIASALMHWFISQSFYLLSVDFLSSIESEDLSYVTCGYSAIAIIFGLGLAGLMLLVIFVNGFRRVTFDMPLVGGCSMAISASCHAPAEGADAAKALQWGVVDSSDDVPQPEVGHCSFSSAEVSMPVEGDRYAGLPL